MIMDTDEYERKVTTILSDDKTGEKLKKHPTRKYKRQLVSIIRKVKEDNKITEKQYKFLYPTAENLARMFCTPKIHKPDNPLRPIVDDTGSIGYNVSRSLADLLALIVGKNSHHIKNSKLLANEMASIMIEQDEADRKPKLRTNLNVYDIMELLKFIVTTTYFSFFCPIY